MLPPRPWRWSAARPACWWPSWRPPCLYRSWWGRRGGSWSCTRSARPQTHCNGGSEGQRGTERDREGQRGGGGVIQYLWPLHPSHFQRPLWWTHPFYSWTLLAEAFPLSTDSRSSPRSTSCSSGTGYQFCSSGGETEEERLINRQQGAESWRERRSGGGGGAELVTEPWSGEREVWVSVQILYFIASRSHLPLSRPLAHSPEKTQNLFDPTFLLQPQRQEKPEHQLR